MSEGAVRGGAARGCGAVRPSLNASGGARRAARARAPHSDDGAAEESDVEHDRERRGDGTARERAALDGHVEDQRGEHA